MKTSVTFEEIEKAKAYVTPSGVPFRNPAEYVEMFFNSTGTNETNTRFELQSKTENANEDKSLNTAYGRLLIESKFDEYKDPMNTVGKIIGMVIALDTAQPTVKVYTGGSVFACSNLCISGAEHIFSANAMTNLESAFNMAENYKNKAEEDWLKNLATWKKMQETVYSGSQINEKFGKMLELILTTSSFKGLGTSPIIHAAKEVYNPGSIYSILSTKTCTGWNLYNAITQGLTDTNDIVRTPGKSLIASNLILS